MATSAFKSNSKRSDVTRRRNPLKVPNPNNSPPPQKPKLLRRSLSVNAALSRSTEFFNKTDNPLYWTTTNTEAPTNVVGHRDRGRELLDRRCSDQKISGRRRSLSRARSPRLPYYYYEEEESEAEQESRIPITHNQVRGQASSSSGKLPVSGTKTYERSSRPLVCSSFDSQVPNCEDGISTSSLSEAEEKTIKAVFEQMKSFEVDTSRKDTASIEIYETVRSEVRRAIADIQDDLHEVMLRNSSGALVSTDISPKLVNLGAVELVLDIRKEYAKELEASQERARKLRSDLAMEEHHRQELSRILKETLREPKTSSSHTSRLGRKSSSERKKMSKRLTDEAMSYFDEYVSISTFDSSDFSAAEDPSVNSVTIGSNCRINQQIVQCDQASSSVVDSSCNELVTDTVETTDSTERDRKFLFSFSHKQTESVKLQHEIESYIKTFDKDKSTDGITSRYNYNTDAYELLTVNESLLFDKVFFKNQQESGSLHVCGGVAVPFLPFYNLF